MGKGIKMIFDYIKLKNYRQYRDVIINFNGKKSRNNIIVIEGTTGAGKTNLLNAVTWCLYGEELYLTKDQRGLPLLNTLTLHELNIGKTATIEIEIQLLNKENKIFRIKRISREKKMEKDKTEQVNENVTMFAQINDDMTYIEEPNRLIKRIFPKKIFNYFFFDGERLDAYFKKGAGKKIKDAVYHMSHLDLLERMISHMNNARYEFFRQEKTLAPKPKRINEEISNLNKSLKKEEKKLKKYKKQKEEAEKNRKEIHDNLIDISPKEIKKLVVQRKSLEGKLNRLENNKKEEEKDKNDYLIKIAPPILASNVIYETQAIISKRKEAGEIPPAYKKNFLEKLLKEGRCICSTDISKNGIHRKNVEKLYNECEDITNITGEIIELYGELKKLHNELINFDKDRTKYNKKIDTINNDIREINKKLKMIEEEIKESDIEKIKNMEEMYEEYNKEIDKITRKIGASEAEISEIKKQIKKLEWDLEKELDKEKKYKELRKINSFCIHILNITGRIKNEIINEIKEQIEKRTKKQFFGIIPKEKTYIDVKIDGNYNFSVLDQEQRESLGTLSSGERESLALSFIAALNTVSGIDVPIIIDTPLARIDKEPRKDIAKNIPLYFKENQIILLVTSAEYTDYVKEALSNNVYKEYKIKFKEYEHGSECEVMLYD